jgi:hypothetical protein
MGNELFHLYGAVRVSLQPNREVLAFRTGCWSAILEYVVWGADEPLDVLKGDISPPLLLDVFLEDFFGHEDKLSGWQTLRHDSVPSPQEFQNGCHFGSKRPFGANRTHLVACAAPSLSILVKQASFTFQTVAAFGPVQ